MSVGPIIMLPLKRDSIDTTCGAVWFRGEGHGEGFVLEMPTEEWDYLERPERIEFIVTCDRLAVSFAGNVRKYR